MSFIKVTGLNVWPLLVCMACFAIPIAPLIASENHVSDQQTRELARLRAFGLEQDHSHVTELVQALTLPAHPSAVKASLHSLAQMGAVEALPEVNDVCLNAADQDTRAYAQVARARLVAEGSVKSLANTQAQAEIKVARFYQELGITPEGLNAASAKNQASLSQPQPLEVYAIRELADMVYHGKYSDFTALPGIKRVDFHYDYPASLKMRLVATDPAQRLNTMLQELAHQNKWKAGENYEIQLAADEGQKASKEVSDQLGFMANHRNLYPQYGFEVLFQVLEGMGDKEQAALLQGFMNDKDGGIAQSAQSAYYYTVWGLQRQRAVGY